MNNMDKTNISNSGSEGPLTGKVTIGIAGMSCDNCAKRVERTLRALAGVKEVTVDRAGAVAQVTFDSSLVTIPAMRDALLKSGYEPVNPTDSSR